MGEKDTIRLSLFVPLDNENHSSDSDKALQKCVIMPNCEFKQQTSAPKAHVCEDMRRLLGPPFILANYAWMNNQDMFSSLGLSKHCCSCKVYDSKNTKRKFSGMFLFIYLFVIRRKCLRV